MGAYLHIAFAPNIPLVSTVRRFTGEFYQRVLVDPELASRVALATHELLENAVAFAIDGETDLRIEIRESDLVIQTSNRAASENVAQLRATIDAIARVRDPEQHYQHVLDRAVRCVEGSGVGLARIRAEADMVLSCEIDPDRRVRVLARTALKKGQAA